jgi:tRNA(His) 5'-end guanylyltransferase
MAKSPPKITFINYEDDELLDTNAAAVVLGGVSHQWLELARFKGHGPRYIKVTSRLVRYRMGDLREYLKKRAVETKAVQ